MVKNKGGFREAIAIKREMKEVETKVDSLLVYMIKKILDEEYIFITGTEDLIDTIMYNEGLKIEAVEMEGKEVEIGDKKGTVEKLFMTKKDDSLKEFMNGRSIEKLVGLVIRKHEHGREEKHNREENDIKMDIIVAAIDDDREFNLKNVGNMVLKVFPRFGRKSVERLQKDILNMIMVDGILEMQGKKLRR